MSVKPVLRMGEPCLIKKAEKIEAFNTPHLLNLIQDLEDTMAAMQGAGIAAPQIGVSERVVIFGEHEDNTEDNPRYPDKGFVPYTVLINPIITPLSDKQTDGWEGCLSVPGMRGIVPRYEKIRYQGFDQFGNPIDRTVEGFHARVVQHECDHLEGILYPMRIIDMTKFGYLDVFFPEQNVQDS